MSGIATATKAMTDQVEDSQMKILDTRKTVPGLRLLDKIAVVHGGGLNHRMGLYDMMMIKDNHIAAAGGISQALERGDQYLKNNNIDENVKIEIETSSLDEVKQVLQYLDGKNGDTRVFRIMLDNMVQGTDIELLQQAVQLINGRVETEASGDSRTLPQGGGKGFGFASFITNIDAAAAIKKLNGKKLLGRTVVVDWAVGKSQYQAEINKTSENQEAEDDDTIEDTNAQQDHHAQKQENISSKLVTEEEDFEDSEDESEDVEVESASGSDVQMDQDDQDDALSEAESDDELETHMRDQSEVDESDEREDLSNTQLDTLEVEEDEDEQKHNKSIVDKFLVDQQQTPKNNNKDTTKPKKQTKDIPEKQSEDSKKEREEVGLPTTVYIRGLPIDAAPSDLEASLVKFGPIKSCRLVKNKNTDKCTGCAFVEFRSQTACKAAVAAGVAAKKGEGPALSCIGTEIHVNKAVSSDNARDLAKVKAAKQQKQDKRNIYLMKEGQILQGSAAWDDMSQIDQQRRKAASKEREQKLQSPMFFISKTTLFIRNVPPKITAQEIKKIVVDAVKARATKENPQVVKSSIMKHRDRKDSDGKAKSRGVAVVELSQHDHALAALRHLNNNPNVFTKEKRPIVEFAIESKQAIELHEKLKQSRKQQRAQKQEAGEAVQKEDKDKDADLNHKQVQNQKNTNKKNKKDKDAELNHKQPQNQKNTNKRNKKGGKEVSQTIQNGQQDDKHPGKNDTNVKLSKNKKRKLERQKKEFDPEVRDKFIQKRLERKQQKQDGGKNVQIQQKEHKQRNSKGREKIDGGVKKKERVDFKEKRDLKKQKRKGDSQDKLDALIQKYTSKYFK
eukprot:TRINITY_DN389_c0_g1_i5.p1 TRINITY_DN389_c0_g1~~TRINITY_DN389_c0_g1_i5.p1  ORF type:complete len:991 (+),score=235.19 TRINITY_DN389_c0_g1_i5:444-2975(+)